MKSIKKELEYKYIINKSEFISVIKYIDDVNDVDIFIEELKKRFKDATHYCYAYIINNYKKCSDDKEPQGTAGLPILNVLEKNELTTVICVVIRYFGGIKLGAGGLVRAYSNSIIEALDKTNIVELVDGYMIEMIFDYGQVKVIDYILKDRTIIEKEYGDSITYKFYLNEDELNIVSELEKIAIHISIKDKVLIQKN